MECPNLEEPILRYMSLNRLYQSPGQLSLILQVIPLKKWVGTAVFGGFPITLYLT